MKNLITLLLFVLFNNSNAQSVSPKILITYYSKTGNTKVMANEVLKGVQSIQGVIGVIKSIDKTTQKDLIEADAIIVGSPVINANAAPEIIKFMSEWPFAGKPLKDKIGATFVTGGGISAGEELVQVNLLHSMMIFGMIIVGGEDWTSAFGASAITNESLFQKKQSIDSLFLRKGYQLGKRVATISKKIK